MEDGTVFDSAMGGEVLELLNDRAQRLEREAENRGLERGIEQGIEQGATDLADLLKGLGVDEEVIDKAMATLRERREQATSDEPAEEDPSA